MKSEKRDENTKKGQNCSKRKPWGKNKKQKKRSFGNASGVNEIHFEIWPPADKRRKNGQIWAI